MTEFADTETYRSSGKDPLSFRLIVLEHLQAILRITRKEFRGGYYIERPITTNSGGSYIAKEYVADSREEFSNSVDGFSDSLLPFFDKEMEKSEREVQEDLKKAYSECIRDQRGVKVLDSEIYSEKRLKIQRRLFRELSRFLHRIDYLNAEFTEEGV